MLQSTVAIALVLLCCISYSPIKSESTCGDWAPYKDEHCFKAFTTVGLVDFDAAQAVCHSNDSHLIIIRYAEEQAFLTNLLFNKSKLVDNVWIDARYDETSSSFKWKMDGSQMTFTNWAPNHPKSHANYCVQMQAEEDFYGKWFSEPCTKKNAVVCQKPPQWSNDMLQKTMVEFKHNLEEIQAKLSQAEAKLTEAEKQIVPLGFTYVQLPKDKSPTEIWPSLSWTDVSSQYSGLFFRVEGDKAESFGSVQEASQSRISQIIVHDSDTSADVKSGGTAYLNPGSWSQDIGTAGAMGYWYSWRIYTTNDETRPRNMAMRVWKRTG